MALPLSRYVNLGIEYDGTVKKLVKETVTTTETKTDADLEYEVVRGDCLWNLAKRFYGDGMRYIDIYNANRETMDATARQHGFVDANGGNYIWAGEILKIPGQSVTTTTTSEHVSVQTVGESHPELAVKMARQATAFSYTDVASGQSDSMQLTMHDIGKDWMGSLMPQRGADIVTKIGINNYEGVNSLDCGKFIIDDISFSGKPTTCTIGAVSVPANDDFKSEPATSTWEKTTLKEIASKIAGLAGIELVYDADTIQIDEIEQSSQTNSAFLYSLCDKYGLSMKVYNNKLVIFDTVKYEEKDPVTYFTEGNLLKWSYNTTIEGTYTGVNFSYTDPDQKDPIKVTMGEQGRMYTINTQASSKYDAELQAAAKVNQANRQIETLNITIKPVQDRVFVASQCVQIYELGKIDGKYYIDSVKHNVGSSGYTLQLTMHKVQKPIKVTQPVAASAPANTYTVVAGDTLWGIAKRYYDNGMRYIDIYNANKESMDATARSHGFADANGGNYIWAGQVLTIP